MARQTKPTPVAEPATGVTSKEEANTVPETTQVNPEQELEQLKAENSVLKEKVDALETELDQVKKLYENLGIQNTSLQDNVSSLNREIDGCEKLVGTLKGYIAELEEYKAAHLVSIDLQDKNVSAEVVKNDVVSEEEAPIVLEPFNYEGNLYTLTDNAPKKIAFNDHVYTQEELLNDEQAMISLIVGENAFIKQIV